MGFLDKFKKNVPDLKAKAADLAKDHNDKIDSVIDKAADAADKVSGGKHTAKIDGAADKAKDAVDGLADDGKA